MIEVEGTNMSKALIKPSRCRDPKCLKPLDTVKNDDGSTKYPIHYTDPNYCNKCKSKRQSKKRRLKRIQKKYGISTRNKKKVVWKTKSTPTIQNQPITVFYMKRNRGVIFTKFSLTKRWKRTTKKQLSVLEKKYFCGGNPEYK